MPRVATPCQKKYKSNPVRSETAKSRGKAQSIQRLRRKSKHKRVIKRLRRLLISSGAITRVHPSGASCMYGSPHQKEFRLLGANIDRSHSHVIIQGKYTKASATYTHELAEAFATEISRALRRKKAVDSYHQIDSVGLESPLFNDVVLASRWKTSRVWRWKRQKHINIQESAAVLKLLQREARDNPRTRFSNGVDSHVSLAALAKGRSPSFGLRGVVRKIAATTVAGCLYPAYHFC